MEYCQKVKQIIAQVEAVAPLSRASSWDNSGWQFVAEREDIHKLALCLDASPLNVQKAIDLKAEMLITHHPLSLEAKYLNVFDEHYQVIKLLMQAQMPLYAAHTSLDTSAFALWLADELCLQDCQVLDKQAIDNQAWGFGAVGNLPNPMNLYELHNILHSFFPQTLFRFAGQKVKKIERVAFCGGSGASLIDCAKEQKADIYISGDFKYHSTENLSAYSSEQKSLLLLDVGHFALEEEMMKRFSQYLQEQMPKLDICFIPSKDPFFTII